MKLLAVLSAFALCMTGSFAVKPLQVRIDSHDISTHNDLVVDSRQPRFSWQLASDETSRSFSQLEYELQVTSASPSHQFTYESGKVESSQSTYVTLPEGVELAPDTRYVAHIRYWDSNDQVSDWIDAPFRTALMDGFNSDAQWISRLNDVWNEVRRPFTVDSSKTVQSATAFIAGIGYYHLYFNGENVDPSRKLDPGWTTYQKRVLYTSFDVTSMLQSGDNMIGVQLGSGWYSQEQYRDGVDQPSYGPPRLLFQMAINYTDGSTDYVTSDDKSGWVGRQGANMHDGVYMGSIYDARAERADWATTKFVDPTTLWLPAAIVPSPLDADGVLSLQPMDPIRLPPDNLHIATSARLHPGKRGAPDHVFGADLAQSIGIITPTAVGGSSEGQTFDLGQNMAGWCQIKATGRRGMAVHIRYSETLALPNPQVAHGLYTENLRQAASTDLYIFKSDDTPEIIEPQFTVHGFRYISIQGAKNGIANTDIQCLAVHTETTLKGNFTTSNAVMNQIQHNILWGQLSNLMSLPTDCPQRDERKGWMGDAGLTVDEALFNFDLSPFYYNFLQLIADDQQPNGGVSDTVPHTYGNNPSDPNWGTAFPTIAYALYDHYGDTGAIAKHLANITAYVEQLRGDYKGTGLKNLRIEFGDWVPPPPAGQTNGHLISSFPFMRDVMTLSKMYALMNQTAVARQYQSFYGSLATEFHSTFYTNDSIGYADGMQTANALALALPGVVPQAKVKNVVNALVNDIKTHGSVTTGIVGFAQLFPVLSANGQHDLALTLAQQTSYPSLGYMSFNAVENATTLWELFNSPDAGPGMDSRNHIMFGSIGAWFYRDVAGINPNGLETILVRPRMARDASLSPEVHAEVVTVKGLISVDYVRDPVTQSINMKVVVPANAQAKLSLEPLSASGKCATIHESGKLIYQSAKVSMYDREEVVAVESIRMIERDPLDGTMHLQIESGTYEFSAVWA